MDWIDSTGLEAVEARFGIRASRHICVYGPVVFAHMIAVGEPFRSTNIVRLMRDNEYPMLTENNCRDIVMQVIRYINFSGEPYYVQQRRVRKTYMWVLFNPGEHKSKFREQDAAFAAKSRVHIERPYVAPPIVIGPQRGLDTTPRAEPQSTPHIYRPPTATPKIAARVASMQPVYLNYIKAAFTNYFDAMKMPTDSITPERMTKIYYSPGFAQYIPIDTRDELTDFNEEQMVEAFTLVADMLTADARGANASLTGPDGKLDLL